jgi:alpha-1,6-mannosyltransferase
MNSLRHLLAIQKSRLQSSSKDTSALFRLAGIGALLAGLTVVTPFAFRTGGDNAFIALTIPAGLLTIAAAYVAERAPGRRALLLIFGLAIALRGYVLLFDPLLSSDIYRYIWDGKVQAAGINPYRYFPAHQALAALHDTTIFPRINRADYAVTIYPPVAEFFFLLVTRLGANTTVMRLALLACEAVSMAVMLLLLKRMQRPLTRIVAYAWHPLPIWEIANSGHVDALMMALMLLGLWVALTGRALRGALLISLAALVKPFAAPALAVIWRPWDWKMPLTLIATIALCYLPYLSVGWGVFGFLTKGYLTEEGLVSGNEYWPLSVWRLAFGAHRDDVALYAALAISILLLMALWVAHHPIRTIASSLANINMLLLAVLLLCSPNYPWYFLVTTPFVALCGNAPTWAMSIGALLLTDEVDWDFHIPTLIVKSVLYGVFLLACGWSVGASYRKQTVDGERAT